ncbi:MAG: hypothetical protein IJ222_01075 [Bacteroidales bacterium]|nr:hypothetical protein [Bacteroidales bacterium]
MLSAQLLPDGSVQFVAYWNKGDLMKYQVVQRNERIDEKGDTTVIKSSSEVMSLEVADVTDSTYTLAVRSDDLFSVDTRIKDDSFLERVEMSPIRLVTDSFGTPKYYENLDELVEETKALIPQIVESIYKSVNKNDRKLLDKKAMKENLVASLATPEFIEAICEEEVTALLQFHGVRLDTTSMFTVPSQRTVLNSEPIDVNTDFWVDSAQTDSTFAVIRMHTHIGLDQLSGVAASFADWSLSLFKGNHEGDVASELDKTFDTVFKDMEGGVDEYSFLLIHLPTGWPVQYEFYKETTISHDGKTFQQIESRTVELLSEDDE